MLITDHNVRETLGICDRAYIISEGGVLAGGQPTEIIGTNGCARFYLASTSASDPHPAPCMKPSPAQTLPAPHADAAAAAVDQTAAAVLRSS